MKGNIRIQANAFSFRLFNKIAPMSGCLQKHAEHNKIWSTVSSLHDHFLLKF